MNNIVVYWIKYQYHNDPYSEGYIGVSTNFNKRKWAHEHGKSGQHIHNRISNGATFEIIHECDTLEEALYLEENYRSQENIGWNLAKGGGMPPSQTGKSYSKQKLRGSDRTEAQKIAHKMQAEKIRGRPSPRRGVKLSQETKEKMGRRVRINGIEYGTFSDAAIDIKCSVATITTWSKKGSGTIKRRNGDILLVEFM